MNEFTVLLLTTSYVRAFQVVIILISLVKMLGNCSVEMFHNEFFSVVPCFVIEVISEEHSCTGSGESSQVFKYLN